MDIRERLLQEVIGFLGNLLLQGFMHRRDADVRQCFPRDR